MRNQVRVEVAMEHGTLTDLSAGTWRTQRFILVAYLTLTLIGLVTWGQNYTVVPVVAAVIAWAGQWGLTVITLRVLHTRFGRYLRNTAFMVGALFFTVLVMSIFSTMVFGSEARINGWAILWRFVSTLLITTITARLSALSRVLEEESKTQNTLQVVRNESLNAIRVQRQSVIDQINDQMNRALQRAAVNTQEVSAELSQFAREFLRPLSHEILNNDSITRVLTTHTTKKSSWREIAGAVSLQPALRPWLMATAVFITFLFTTVETPDRTPTVANDAAGLNLTVQSSSLFSSFAFLGIVFVVTGVSAMILQRWLTPVLPRLALRNRLILLALVPIIIAIIMEFFVQLLFLVPGFTTNLSPNPLVRLVPAIAIVSIGLIIVFNRTLKELFLNAEDRARQATHDLSWELSRLQCAATREQRYFASQLHGPLQSTFTSAAMRTADIEAGAPEWDAALAAIKSDFETTIGRLASGPEATRNFFQALDDLRQTWTGVCEISIAMEDYIVSSLESDWVASGIVVDIVVEACANAAIHGSAKNIHVDMRWCGTDELLITAVNDGSVDTLGAPGMGTAMLDRVAMSWSREVLPEGLCLRVNLAVPQLSSVDHLVSQ